MEQTAGRGRRGRRWSSPPGNLYASLILRPDAAPDRAAQLGFVAALAVADALRELAPELGEPACKWPNDILVGGHKIAGILLESEMGEGQNLAFLIVGVGINLVSAPPDAEYPATSIAGEGRPPPAPRGGARRFRPALRRMGAALEERRVCPGARGLARPRRSARRADSGAARHCDLAG